MSSKHTAVLGMGLLMSAGPSVAQNRVPVPPPFKVDYLCSSDMTTVYSKMSQVTVRYSGLNAEVRLGVMTKADPKSAPFTVKSAHRDILPFHKGQVLSGTVDTSPRTSFVLLEEGEVADPKVSLSFLSDQGSFDAKCSKV